MRSVQSPCSRVPADNAGATVDRASVHLRRVSEFRPAVQQRGGRSQRFPVLDAANVDRATNPERGDGRLLPAVDRERLLCACGLRGAGNELDAVPRIGRAGRRSVHDREEGAQESAGGRIMSSEQFGLDGTGVVGNPPASMIMPGVVVPSPASMFANYTRLVDGSRYAAEEAAIRSALMASATSSTGTPNWHKYLVLSALGVVAYMIVKRARSK